MANQIKITRQAKAMVNADIHRVSLVSVGANHAPFKVLKNKEAIPDMTTNTNLSQLITKAQQVPLAVVEAFVLSDEMTPEDFTAKVASLKLNGFSTDTIIQSDNCKVIPQVTEFAETNTTIQIVKGVSVVVSQVDKMFAPWAAEGNLATKVKAEGFYPSLYTATDVMIGSIQKALDDSETAPVDSVEKTINEYSKYVTSLLKALPESVFKAFDVVMKGGLINGGLEQGYPGLAQGVPVESSDVAYSTPPQHDLKHPSTLGPPNDINRDGIHDTDGTTLPPEESGELDPPVDTGGGGGGGEGGGGGPMAPVQVLASANANNADPLVQIANSIQSLAATVNHLQQDSQQMKENFASITVKSKNLETQLKGKVVEHATVSTAQQVNGHEIVEADTTWNNFIDFGDMRRPSDTWQ